MHDIQLQPLRIPAGWSVTFNEFRELDPEAILDPDSTLWSYFREDMLQVEHAATSTMVDLGWYPECDATGTYRALVVQIHDVQEQTVEAWQTPRATFTSRSLVQVIAQLEMWFQQQ
jgi:hypothetical protein